MIAGDGISLVYQPSKLETTFTKVRSQINNTLGLYIHNLQIDNQVSGRGNFDFPVVLKKQTEVSNVQRGVQDILKKVGEDRLKSLKEKSIIAADIMMSYDLESVRAVIETIDLTVQPLILFVEDTFVYEVIKKIDR